MGFGKLLRGITKRPAVTALCTSAPFLGLTAIELYNMLASSQQQGVDKSHVLSIMKLLSPFIAMPVSYVTSSLLNRLTYDQETLDCIKECEEKVKARQAPKCPPLEKVKIPFKLKDFSVGSLASDSLVSIKKLADYARENRQPILMMQAAEKYINSKNLDEALICIRDAIDFSDGKTPKVSWMYRLGLAIENMSYSANKYVRPDDISARLFYAAAKGLVDPVESWRISAVGKEIAKELDHEMKTEAAVFHALLATAQRRSDEHESWSDSFRLLQNAGTPELLAESTNPVWVLKNKDGGFFTNTFAFKGNKSREALVEERKCYEKLEEILQGEAQVPQPLYISEELQNGLYVYVMRYAQGETLYEKLKKNDKSAMSKSVEILAKILARYPTQGLPQVDTFTKTRDKLYSPKLGIPKDLADAILADFEPVAREIDEDALIVARKDGHTEQVQVDENGNITVLDAEMNASHPAILEAANKLNYGNYFTPDERRQYVMQFAETLRAEGRRQNNSQLAYAYGDRKKLFRSYNHAVMQRGLCFTVAWLGRSTMQEEADAVMQLVIGAGDELKKDDPEFYKPREQKYQRLKKNLGKLREYVA